jgi:hypothetical protein
MTDDETIKIKTSGPAKRPPYQIPNSLEVHIKNISRGLAEGDDQLLIEFLKEVFSIEIINPPPPGVFSLKYLCVDGKRRYEIQTIVGERAIKSQGRIV